MEKMIELVKSVTNQNAADTLLEANKRMLIFILDGSIDYMRAEIIKDLQQTISTLEEGKNKKETKPKSAIHHTY